MAAFAETAGFLLELAAACGVSLGRLAAGPYPHGQSSRRAPSPYRQSFISPTIGNTSHVNPSTSSAQSVRHDGLTITTQRRQQSVHECAVASDRSNWRIEFSGHSGISVTATPQLRLQIIGVVAVLEMQTAGIRYAGIEARGSCSSPLNISGE
jgi:hypothetical protein